MIVPENEMRENNNVFKILITGNGFDLAHELPTSYNDFIAIMLILFGQNAEDELEKYLNMKISKTSYNLSNINYSDIVDKFYAKETDRVKDIIDYFDNAHKIEKWVDFENEIKTMVETIVHLNEWSEKNIIAIGISPHGIIVRTNNSVKSISAIERKTIRENCDKIGFLKFIITNEEIKNMYKKNRIINTSKILDELNLGIGELENLFNWYITNIIDVVMKEHKSVVDSSFLESINYYVTFNYTNTIDKLYKNKMINNSSYHIHGSSEKENILFGYHYNEDEMPSIITQFTKVFKRIHYETDYTAINDISKSIYNKITNGGFYQDEEAVVAYVEVYFWGHSLDATDTDIIVKIFDYKQRTDVDVKYIIYHHNMESKFSILNNLFEILGRNKVEEYTSSKLIRFEEKSISAFK